ncbi:uncharacterized protein LOC127281120 isoform X3 [Leptopilina boulardi]|uniref:uncharacterized protein LOC127281120 isoform X3 n=1 Tax=Leptopilina boulardi TaxID=63433 RepID=UPI0021F58C3D|nr:uncharacterized protein LOC127281120 isoform X3 [Leptopilina boulardi]
MKMTPVKNYKHINGEQKEKLIEFMLQHRDLAAGKINRNNYKQTADHLYVQLASILNSVVGGSVKDVDGWKKCWMDLRRKTIEKEFYRRKLLNEHSGEEVHMSDIEKIIVEKLVPKERLRTKEVDELKIKEEEISINENETQEHEMEHNPNVFYLADYEEDDNDRKDIINLLPPSTSEAKRKMDFAPTLCKKSKLNDEDDELEEDNFFEINEARNSKELTAKDESTIQLLRERVELKRRELELKEQMWKKTEEHNERKMKLKIEMQEKIISCLERIADELQNHNTYLRSSS